MTGAIWNLLLGLAWVLLSGDFSGLNLLVGMIFGYIALLLIEPQVDGLKGYPARVPRFIGFLGFFIKELVQGHYAIWQTRSAHHANEGQHERQAHDHLTN